MQILLKRILWQTRPAQSLHPGDFSFFQPYLRIPGKRSSEYKEGSLHMATGRVCLRASLRNSVLKSRSSAPYSVRSDVRDLCNAQPRIQGGNTGVEEPAETPGHCRP